MADEHFLVWSNEHDAWWGPNHRGYSTNVLAAGIYSRADAEEIVANSDRREEMRPLSAVKRPEYAPGTLGYLLAHPAPAAPACPAGRAPDEGTAPKVVRGDAEAEHRRAKECIDVGCVWYAHANALSADLTRFGEERDALREVVRRIISDDATVFTESIVAALEALPEAAPRNGDADLIARVRARILAGPRPATAPAEDVKLLRLRMENYLYTLLAVSSQLAPPVSEKNLRDVRTMIEPLYHDALRDQKAKREAREAVRG